MPDDPATKAAKQAIARRLHAEEQHARAMRNAARNAIQMQAQEERRQRQLERQLQRQQQEQQQQRMQQMQQQQQQQQHYMQDDAIHSYKQKTTFVSASSQNPYGAPAARFAPMTISSSQTVFSSPPSGPISYDPRSSVLMPSGPLQPAVQNTYTMQTNTYVDEQPQNYGSSISYHTENSSFAKIKI